MFSPLTMLKRKGGSGSIHGTADCKIFQSMTIPDIITQVFDDLGYNDYADTDSAIAARARGLRTSADSLTTERFIERAARNCAVVS